MRKIISVFLFLALLVLVNGCGVQKLARLKECNFSFGKVTSVSWAGIDFTKVISDYKSLDLSSLAKVTRAVTSGDYKVRVGLTLNASNPNRKDAGLAGFDYILYYKNEKVGAGESLNSQDILIPANGERISIPLSLDVDFRDLVNLKQLKSAEGAFSLVNSILNIGKSNTDFQFKVRPHVRIGNQTVKSIYLNIN